MSELNVFEVATRNKYRFVYRGTIGVEDLWDLSLESLDTIYKNLNQLVKQSQEESLLNKRSQGDKELDVKIEVVKHIVAVKLDEAEKSRLKKEKREQKQKIMEVLRDKEESELQGKSKEDLLKMLEELD